MPSVLDEFVLQIGWDTAGFQRTGRLVEEELTRTERHVEAFGRHIEQTGAKIGEAFSFIKRGAMGIVATFAGAEAATFIERLALMDAHTSRVAQSIGMATPHLGAWNTLLQTAGAGEGAGGELMGGLADYLYKIAHGQATPTPQFQKLMSLSGVGMTGYLDPEGSLRKMMSALSRQTPMDQRQMLAEVPGAGGNTGLALMQLINDPQFMRNMIERIDQAGKVSEENAKAAKALQAETVLLEAQFRVLARQILPDLVKVAKDFGDALQAILDFISGKQGVEDIVKIEPGSIADRIRQEGSRSWDWLKRHWGDNTAPGTTRGDRNNNPGNIEDGPWARAHGAIGSDGRFAIFADQASGTAAMAALLSERYRGLTLAQIQRKWVGNQDPAYLASMSAATGLGANDVPSMADTAKLYMLMQGMSRGEGTHLAPPATGKQSSVTIGTINVMSNNADPKKVADQIPEAMRRYSMLAGANTGLV